MPSAPEPSSRPVTKMSIWVLKYHSTFSAVRYDPIRISPPCRRLGSFGQCRVGAAIMNPAVRMVSASM
jgi:hypothetical protein